MPRGRPKGSKNKPKNVAETPIQAAPEQKRRGRPKGSKNKPKKYDGELTRSSDIESIENLQFQKGRHVISNYNPKKEGLTARMYGSLNKDQKTIIEADGEMSYKGPLKMVQPKNGKPYYELTDGRRFDVFGWPMDS